MKARNTIQYTTIIITLSILTSASEFALLHIFNWDVYAVMISCGIVLLVSLLLLGAFAHYESVFIYLLLNVLFTTILAGYRFWELQYFYYSPTNLDLWMIILNYTVPVIICLLHNLFSSRTQLEDYRRFVKNTGLLFLLYFTGIYCYIQFIPHPGSLWSSEQTNVIPFYTLATYIEKYIYGDCAFREIFSHLLLPVLLYLPIGFFVALWMRHSHRVLQLLLLILIPTATEAIQILIHSDALNVDHIIYAILGGILGELLLYIINGLFLLVKGSEFAQAEQNHISGMYF